MTSPAVSDADSAGGNGGRFPRRRYVATAADRQKEDGVSELVAKGASLGIPTWVGLGIGVLGVIGMVVMVIVYGGKEENGDG